MCITTKTAVQTAMIHTGTRSGCRCGLLRSGASCMSIRFSQNGQSRKVLPLGLGRSKDSLQFRQVIFMRKTYGNSIGISNTKVLPSFFKSVMGVSCRGLAPLSMAPVVGPCALLGALSGPSGRLASPSGAAQNLRPFKAKRKIALEFQRKRV